MYLICKSRLAIDLSQVSGVKIGCRNDDTLGNVYTMSLITQCGYEVIDVYNATAMARELDSFNMLYRNLIAILSGYADESFFHEKFIFMEELYFKKDGIRYSGALGDICAVSE